MATARAVRGTAAPAARCARILRVSGALAAKKRAARATNGATQAPWHGTQARTVPAGSAAAAPKPAPTANSATRRSIAPRLGGNQRTDILASPPALASRHTRSRAARSRRRHTQGRSTALERARGCPSPIDPVQSRQRSPSPRPVWPAMAQPWLSNSLLLSEGPLPARDLFPDDAWTAKLAVAPVRRHVAALRCACPRLLR